MQKFSSVALDAYGNVLPGTIVSVYNAGTLVLSSIFSDNIGTVLANPFAVSSNGAYYFYAANGRYDVVLAKSGFTFNAVDTSDILLYDPSGAAGTQFGGHLFGLTLSNNVIDTVNDINVAVGEAVSDDALVADRTLMSQTSVITKQIDATWVAGTNAGMRDSSDTIVGAKWFHIYMFLRGSGAVDYFASTSLTPTLPDGGTKKRRIGSIYWTGSTIQAFSQFGDEFLWLARPLDVNVSIPDTSAHLVSLSVPSGITVDALATAEALATVGFACVVYLTCPSVNDETPSATAAPLATVLSILASQSDGASIRMRTNTSSQIRYRATSGGSGQTLRIATSGWIDYRGRLS